MKDFYKIEELIKKLRNNTLTQDETDELKVYFESEEPSGELSDLFVEYWDNSSRYNKDIDINKKLSDVHNRLGLTGKSSNDEVNAVLLKQYINPILKYAAVFVLAFATAFLLLKQANKEQTGDMPFSENTTIEVSYGSKSKVNLPDGSIVHLNSGSKLTYPAQFKKGKREVFLDGEAYFEVKSDSLNPFWVNAEEMVIRVIGTVFNVKSYKNTGMIEATLVSGSLEVTSKNELKKRRGKRKSIRLKPNQKAIYIKNIDMLTMDNKEDISTNYEQSAIQDVSVKKNIPIMPEVAWKDNMLLFENAKFEDLIIRLERWYNVKIDLEIEKLNAERFSGKFQNETIEQVLKALQLIEHFDYEIKQNKIRIFTN